MAILTAFRPDLTDPAPEWAVAFRPIPGERETGDGYLVHVDAKGLLIAVADGLGHGSEAAVAARAAIDTLNRSVGEPVESLFQRCHDAMLKTRGGALSIVWQPAGERPLTWGGIGNVEARLIRAAPAARPAQESLLLQGGVVGYRMPRLRRAERAVDPGDLLVLATDGIRSDFAREGPWSDPPQEIATRILHCFGRPTDDALVLVVRFWGGTHG